MTDPIRFDTTLTAKDFRAVCKFNMFRRDRRIMPILITMTVGGIGLLCFTLYKQIPLYSANTVACIFLICFPMVIIFLSDLLIEKYVEKQKLEENTPRRQYVLDNVGVHYSGDGGRRYYPWPQFIGACNLPDYLLLYLQKGVLLILPKKDMVSGTEEELLSLLYLSIEPSVFDNRVKDVASIKQDSQK